MSQHNFSSNQFVKVSLFLAFIFVILIMSGRRPAFAQIAEISACPDQPVFVPNEVLVKFVAEPSDRASNDTVHADVGTIHIDTIAALGVERVQIVTRETITDVIASYNANLNVAYAEPNYTTCIDLTPNDSNFTALWGLHNAGQTSGTADADIDAPEAWEITTGSAAVTIAIIDTGIDYTHPDLDGGRYIGGYDFVNNDNDPIDDKGHGTHVAGTATGDANNTEGIVGVSWNSQFMGIKVLNANGSGTYAQIVAGIIYAADNGAHVANMSLSGGSPSQTLEDAMAYAYNAGVVMTCSAGNTGENDLRYPAAYDQYCLGVAATDHNDQRASFSTYGAFVDVAAPGVSILSSIPGGYYVSWNGTSMAAPHVAGLAALVLAQDSTLSVDEVFNKIRNSADDVNGGGEDDYLGMGRINAFAALDTGTPPSFDCNNVTGISVTECQALVSFYNSTDGDNWVANTDWLQTNTPCSWYGITCTTGSVTHLSLGSNQLNGSIPVALGNLTGLQHLNLCNNELSGGIPTDIGGLDNLQYLCLSGNSVGGSIPLAFIQLTNLEVFLFDNTNLCEPSDTTFQTWLSSIDNVQSTGIICSSSFTCDDVTEIPLIECEALVAFYNSTNSDEWAANTTWLITNTPCSWAGIARCEDGHITFISLSFREISGTLPPELGNLSNLNYFHIRGAELSGSIPAELGNLTNLRGLRLSQNQLSGSIPVELGNLTNLWELSLGYNQLSGSIPVELGNISNLKYLQLRSNQLDGNIPVELGQLSSLLRFRLDNNLLSGPLPINLTNLSVLTSFSFNNTQVCEPSDTQFQAWLNGISSLFRTGVLCSPTEPNLDIADTVVAIYGRIVSVPIAYTAHGNDISSTIFSVDIDEACLAFDATDANSDGIPDAITLNLPAGFNGSVTYDASDTDGELEFFIADTFAPLGSLADGVLATIELSATCQPSAGSTMLAPLLFAATPPVSFGNTDGQAISGTASNGSVEIHSGVAGDCNSDGAVDAGDISALVLEIFDADGSFWLDVPSSTFAGDPAGCDANADTSVDAGDISCTVLTIFNGAGACSTRSDATRDVTAQPELQLPSETTAQIGAAVTLPINLISDGNAISSAVFSIDYDDSLLSFDSSDGNNDGLPDAVGLYMPAGFNGSVTVDVNDSDGEIDIFVADVFLPFSTLPDGLLLELTLVVADDATEGAQAAVQFSAEPTASMGNTNGESLAPVTRSGIIIIEAVQTPTAVTLDNVSNSTTILPVVLLAAVLLLSMTMRGVIQKRGSAES